jgi:hypothetical protein
MSLEGLDVILDTFKSMTNELPDENTVKALLAQSTILGAEASVSTILRSNTWVTAKPYLVDAVHDIPVEQNPEIAARIVNLAEELWPTFISGIGRSTKKTAHIAKILKLIIQEIRNGSTD